MLTPPTGTFSPPLGPPPSFPQPSASPPPSHFSVPFSHSHAHQPTSLYKPTYQTATSDSYGSYLTSRAPPGTPMPGFPSAQGQANSHATIPIAKMIPDLQLLCVPLTRLNSLCLTLSSVSCGPLLKYDTVVNGIWYGACMIVSAYRSHEATEFKLIACFQPPMPARFMIHIPS